MSVVLLVLSTYLGLAYLTRWTQGFYVYEWMNPAHGNWSIVLHIAGYAGGMIALFTLSRCAIMARNWVADKLELTRYKGREMGEKGLKLDDRIDTWSIKIGLEKPEEVRRAPGNYV